MLTVPQAASRIGKDPETVRRWIRSGRLRARKIGTQHLIEAADLDATAGGSLSMRLPKEWRKTTTGDPQPDWVRAIHRSRRAR
jgi:excisionase family DNA binding protein